MRDELDRLSIRLFWVAVAAVTLYLVCFALGPYLKTAHVWTYGPHPSIRTFSVALAVCLGLLVFGLMVGGFIVGLVAIAINAFLAYDLWKVFRDRAWLVLFAPACALGPYREDLPAWPDRIARDSLSGWALDVGIRALSRLAEAWPIRIGFLRRLGLALLAGVAGTAFVAVAFSSVLLTDLRAFAAGFVQTAHDGFSLLRSRPKGCAPGLFFFGG